MFNSKFIRLLYANYRSLRYGFIFYRTKRFQTPKGIFFKCKFIPIVSPNKGTKIFKEIFLHDEYFLRKIRKEFIETIVDVGANVGFFSITAKTYFPTAKIHAYEPSKVNFDFLKKNGLNFNFKTYLNAVGKINCLGQILDLGDAGCLSTFKQDSSGESSMLALSSVINQVGGKVDLLKMDCEGWEYALLSCSEEMRRIKFITMEYHDKTLEEVSQILSDLNFEIVNFFEYPFSTGIILAKNLSFDSQ